MNSDSQKLYDIIDQIKNGKMSPQDAVSYFKDATDPIPSDDEILNNAKELEKSIEPVPLIINDDEINDLLCKYTGEELGNRSVWLILKKQGDIDSITSLPDFSTNKVFDNFLIKNSLESKLLSAKEMLSDNLDLNSLGIVLNKSNIKIRKFNIGPIEFNLHIITNLGKALFYHIAPPNLNLQSIIDKISSKIPTDLPPGCISGASNQNEMLDALKNLLNKDSENKNLTDVYDIVDEIFCDPNISINPETGNPLFTPEDLKKFIHEICLPESQVSPSPIIPEISIDDSAKCVKQTLSQAKDLFTSIRSDNEKKTRYNKAEKEIEELLYHYKISQNFFNDLYSSYKAKVSSKKSIDPLLDFTMVSTLGSDFINSLKRFSIRFSKSFLQNSDYIGVNFGISFKHGLGKTIAYETIKPDINSELLSDSYQTVDLSKLQLGMEFGKDGILGSSNADIVKNYGSFVTIFDELTKSKTDFYSFVSDIEGSDKTKNQIINQIDSDHGYLYSHLIEISASPWLFFTKNERGDNDARKSQDIKPASTDQDGHPNKEFSEFWGNFKSSWDSKYTSQQKIIYDQISKIKSDSAPFIDLLSDYYIKFGASKKSSTPDFLENLSKGIDKRILMIEDLLMSIGKEIEILDKKNSSQSLSDSANSIKCGNEISGVNLNCPSDCCGQAGSSFGKSHIHQSADCPTFYTKCYWKEFSKKATEVGILPMINGIPPIENPGGFLPNIGMKYWPVGYLPPSFIPLPPPIVNPLDGLPFIRIPMPMIWTVVDPVVIPLPIGLMVIFIPMIGGFMPSPLVFFHDFLTNTSIFLLGMRGFRFIPRKSDPIINDPLEKYKKFLSSGIPNYLFPFPNLGGDNVDSGKRVLDETVSNLTKQITNKSIPVDFSEIEKLQNDIVGQKSKLESELLDLKRNRAVKGSDGYNAKKKELDLFNKKFAEEKVSSIKNTIKKYVSDSIDLPDIQFPKQSKNLIAEIPGASKIIKDINLKKKLGTIPDITKINLHSKILNGINNITIPASPEFDAKNKKLSSDSRIVASFSVPLSEIGRSKDDFIKLNDLIVKTTGDYLDSSKSPLSFKSLQLFKTDLKSIPKIGGSQIADVSSLIEIPNPIIDSLKSHLTSSFNVSSNDISILAKNNSIGFNKVLRNKDLKLMVKNVLDKKLSEFPSDLKNFSIPDIASVSNVSEKYSSFLKSIEIPAFPPKKSGAIEFPLGIGGIPQISIPGKGISNFLISGINTSVESIDIIPMIPGGLDHFTNLTADDIKTISKNIAISFTKNSKIPAIENLPPIPLISRPQDYTEFVMNFLPSHPFSDIQFTIEWTKFKGIPKIPISSDIIDPLLKIQELLIMNLPWPIVTLMGRSVINILNPLYNREDLPRWDRMSLKNPFFVIFLDEFIRSAADISGGFKFFIGSGKLLYPLPDLEINLGFGSKIRIN